MEMMEQKLLRWKHIFLSGEFELIILYIKYFFLWWFDYDS